MTKLQAYENALTLFGKIFSELKNKEDRYFFATLKYDFTFFLFALIWKKDALNGLDSSKKTFRLGERFFPRNFNEWRFGRRFLLSKDNDSKFWDLDKKYFKHDEIIKRGGEKMAVLNYGLDLDRFFNLQELTQKEKVGAVIDWRGDLKRNTSFRIIKKWQVFFSALFFYFIFQNLSALFKIYRFLIKNHRTNVSLFDFLRYFVYYAFLSARIRYFLKILSGDKAIGRVIFSDIDNAWGNSFMLWSHFYGFLQTVYPHGSPLYFNQHRYFESEIYYTYTTYQEKFIRDAGVSPMVITSLPVWLKKYSSVEEMITRDAVRKIAFITGMERNLEVSFGDKEILMDYLENLSRLACKKNLSLIIKSHKLLDWHKDYNDFITEYPCVKHIKERWKERDIRQVDLAILTNTETTLTLKFLSWGIPVITCAELLPKILTDHFSIPYFQFVVQTKTELLELIEHFLNDEQFYKKAQEEAVSIFKSLINFGKS